MSKSIFISCVFEDSHRITNINKWANDKRLGNIAITHETEDKRHLGKDAIKEHIKSKIKGCAFILVLIGDNTHNHDWIDAEVELANSYHKKIICVRMPNTTGSVPNLLEKYDLIKFNPEPIKKIIDEF
ncbi:TIR domain-containing protein [Flavobacterium sp. SUN052]|uniref:TIR domain-containing protein n=1 Tax=Flavobacterium sp. SUN052 TaxID=3002441 RepID=UPI00237DFB61|nr:TIR domain-containing protein [Flavobacterium sp. SUN052]MEC4004885.1 TIR domain-containing protein [Flavobacterium sp. SUN052]